MAYGAGHVAVLSAKDGAEVRHFPIFPSDPAKGLGRPVLFRDGVRSLWAFEGADGFAEVDLAGNLTAGSPAAERRRKHRPLPRREPGAHCQPGRRLSGIWDLASGNCIHAQRQGKAVTASAFVDGEAHVLATSVDGRTCTSATSPATPEAEPASIGALTNVAFYAMALASSRSEKTALPPCGAARTGAGRLVGIA